MGDSAGPHLDRTRLQDVVRSVLGEPSAELIRWDESAAKGGFGTLSGASAVGVIEGSARVGAQERSWSVVLKTMSPMPSQGDLADQLDPGHIRYWKREALLYGSRLLEDVPGGLRAPRCYGYEEGEGVVRVWMEHVREDGESVWPVARWALAARHLGHLNAAHLAGWPLPREPWLGGGRLRTWLDRHVPLIEWIAAAPDKPEVRHWWPRATVDAILGLWAEREAYCDALEQLPQGFGHGDAIRRNLLSRGEQTFGVDWEYAGLYALGEDVGQTLSVAAAFHHIDPSELPRLDEAMFAGYLAGLREAGWRGDERRVRFAYCAHAALRNLFNAVGTSLPDEARRSAILANQGLTFEQLAGRRAEIRPFLLERAQEARGMLATLG